MGFLVVSKPLCLVPVLWFFLFFHLFFLIFFLEPPLKDSNGPALKHLLLSSKARRVHFTKFLPNICDIQTRCVCIYILCARACQAYHVNVMYIFFLSCLGINF